MYECAGTVTVPEAPLIETLLAPRGCGETCVGAAALFSAFGSSEAMETADADAAVKPFSLMLAVCAAPVDVDMHWGGSGRVEACQRCQRF